MTPSNLLTSIFLIYIKFEKFWYITCLFTKMFRFWLKLAPISWTIIMSSFTERKYGFCERRMFRKKQEAISCKVCDTSFHKRCTEISGRNFNLVLHNNANCYCQSCFVKNVPSSHGTIIQTGITCKKIPL